MKKLRSMNSVARELGVSTTALRRWIDIGLVPVPEFEAERARLFTPQQVDRIRRTIAERRKHRKAHR